MEIKEIIMYVFLIFSLLFALYSVYNIYSKLNEEPFNIYICPNGTKIELNYSQYYICDTLTINPLIHNQTEKWPPITLTPNYTINY